MLLIFLDTETSGLDPNKHRTLEIAFKIIESSSNRTLSSYESIVVQPSEVWAEADPESLKINGFTWDMFLKGKSERAVSAEIIEMLNDAGIGDKSASFLCQNPSFDRVFFTQIVSIDLQTHYKWPYHWLDLASMYWAMRLIKNPDACREIKESNLSKNQIASYFGLSEEVHPHRAMRGVDHLLACYKAVFNQPSHPQTLFRELGGYEESAQ